MLNRNLSDQTGNLATTYVDMLFIREQGIGCIKQGGLQVSDIQVLIIDICLTKYYDDKI